MIGMIDKEDVLGMIPSEDFKEGMGLLDIFRVPQKLQALTLEELEAGIGQLSKVDLELAHGLFTRVVHDDKNALNEIQEGGKYDRRESLILILHFGTLSQIFEDYIEDYLDSKLSPIYSITYGGNRIRPLSQINTRITAPTVNAISGQAVIKRDGLEVKIKNFNQLISGWGAGVVMFLQYAIMRLAAQSNHKEQNPNKLRPAVEFPLEDYLIAKGTPLTDSNKKYQTRKIEGILRTIKSTDIEWTDPEQYAYEKPLSCPIIGGRSGVKRGTVICTFSLEFAHYVVNTTPYPLHPGIFLLDERNPTAITLGLRMNENYCMDINKNIDKETGEVAGGQYNFIGVETVLKWLSDTIPSREDVRKNLNRQYDQKIVRPLHRALDELANKGVIKWRYLNAKRKPLTKDQLDGIKAERYDTIKDLYIEFELVGYYLGPEDIERIIKNREAAIEEKERQKELEEKAKLKALEENAKKDLKKAKNAKKPKKG